ncbi:SWI/SNF complex component SNF12 homolog [Mercurialis annua]|uniref:SWI/SNF complex component SNF12 homolog n=1 Tax=Mercurialis annua TaxID=3986 RepID=UPI00215DDCED|nr:SWI/SNF complex component SNF12 homolog [Mercurialis annua]XP_050233666.1 SWI/SNF complex component SNF12 homolog [Mercurialis annua]XP_050233667.1 SWI/SNF complex component SNF12 homolog [Mercurialis annua]
MSVNNNGSNNNNNNNQSPMNLGQSSSPFGNAGMVNPSAFSQSQSQAQMASGFQNQFQLSQAQANAQAQLKAQQAAQLQAQARAQAAAHAAQVQSAQAQFQAHFQGQGMSLSQAQNAGIANLGSSSPSFNTPGSMNAKRMPQKPPVRPPGVPMSNMISPLKNMDLTPAARRKKQKLPEKQLQDRVAAILPESALYTQLLEFEARVDSALNRKKVDIQEALKNPPCVQKTLRIYVFNTYANQIRSIPKKPNADPPTWTLKIVGRILEDGIDPDQPGVVQKSNPLYPKLSSFFKRVTIMLDQRLYPDNHMIVWEHSRAPAPHEGFEVKRKGDKEFAVTIRLEMNYVPEKFKLSPALMEVLGIEVDTRPRIIAAIWHYVKARKLQNPEDPSFFNCDPPLQKVFGEAKMKFTMVSQKISQHLSPPQAIILEHKIKLSGNSPAGTACYDVVVDVPFPIQRDLSAMLSNAEKNKEIESCDEAICSAIRKIHDHRRRRAFFLGFSQSPVEFINALIESQSRDLKLVAGEGSRSAEKERRADFFNQPWVEDAVIRYLNRKPAAGSDAPGST